MSLIKKLWDKIPVRISQKGVWIRYKYDSILYPWSWTTSWKNAFFSKALGKEYLSKIQYEDDLNKLLERPSNFESKLEGFSTEDLIRLLINQKYPYGFYVTLHDINPMKKTSDFWRALPEKKAVVLLEDVVVLHCKGDNEVHELCSSIDPGFASVQGWRDGRLIDGNYDDEVSI
jgi:hypothetical protein